MDKLRYREMVHSLECLEREGSLDGKKIYLFGHCNATEELADLLLSKGYFPTAILDNNVNKQGKNYREIRIEPPLEILEEESGKTIVCIVARAYAAMAKQLNDLGYRGDIKKMADYNSFAEYSLSQDTVSMMKKRELRGEQYLAKLEDKYPGYFKVLCPFSALGDVYIMMSYLPYFLQRKRIKHFVTGVVGQACRQVVRMFGDYEVEVLPQNSMDEMIQAALHSRGESMYIAHQDRPYIVDLHEALYTKKISLKQIYCCGVFGLPAGTKPYTPSRFKKYPDLQRIERGNAVIISPYAKSVTSLPDELWEQIVNDYTKQGYQCFTNVAKDECPLPGTQPISPLIAEMQSVVEWAGTFVGIRSGLCDVISRAKARKMVLYPDYFYCDTKWKAIEMYWMEGWENILAGDGFEWHRR